MLASKKCFVAIAGANSVTNERKTTCLLVEKRRYTQLAEKLYVYSENNDSTGVSNSPEERLLFLSVQLFGSVHDDHRVV